MYWKNFWKRGKNSTTKSFIKNQNVVNLGKAPVYEKSGKKKTSVQLDQ